MPENVYTVGQLNKYIKNTFNQDYLLKHLSVSGEVSNCKYHVSGHIYFTLKDESGCINCVMFAGNRSGLAFRMTDGMKVIATGQVDVYLKGGSYQLYANQITQEGSGELYEKFERLKEELEERGMFAAEYKQPIPKNAKTVGIVTASTGAAVRDIINVSKRRNPYINLILYPAIVQGADAAPSIVKGIKALEKYGVDVMIVGRGGGSMEDLWAFNEEIVAQAIFDCSVPIISAVGHEVDFTIADFVADLRAATPSAAAELAVREIADIDNEIMSRRDNLDYYMQQVLRRKRENVQRYERELSLLSPEAKLRQVRERTARLTDRLYDSMSLKIKDKRNRLVLLASKLEGGSPLKKLESGFAYMADEEGKRVKSVKQVKKGSHINLSLTDGYIAATVDSIEEK
jgi:exodeoxyribonuclease VII large subunit